MATYDRHKDNEINKTLQFTSIINQYNIRDIIYQKFDYKLEKLIKSSFIERRENYFKKIIELIIEKQKFIIFCQEVQYALCGLDEQELKIIKMYYIDNKTADTISNELNISIRSFFRKQNKIIEKFFEHYRGEDYKKIGNI